MIDQENRAFGRYVMWFVLALFVMGGASLGYVKVFGPAFESVRREIVEESRAHVTGTNQYIGRLLREYDTADEDHRSALAEMILMEADTIPQENLTPRILARINGLRR